MQQSRPKIAVTMGDPAGVGPEIIAAALADSMIRQLCRPIVIGDPLAIQRGIAVAGRQLRTEIVDKLSALADLPADVVPLFPVSDLREVDIAYGQPSTAAGNAAFAAIVTAAQSCLAEAVDGMATAPINKEALNRAGHHYPGHTELLAELTGTQDFVMMLAGAKLRVALVTIHEALADVPTLLTHDRILATIRTTHRDLEKYFGANPRIAVLALNPHCGEGGLFGREEATVIAPAIAEAIASGIDARGPLSADSLFHFAANGGYDAVICMYHDQGLIPIKLLHFDDAVNVTLGLPIIRTSVDHGTAYDVAGTGTASAASMKAAIVMAAAMAVRRRQHHDTICGVHE